MTGTDLSNMRRMMDEKRKEAMNGVDQAFESLQLQIPHAERSGDHYVAKLDLMKSCNNWWVANNTANGVVTKFGKSLDAGCSINVNSGTDQREGDWCQLQLLFPA
jgi:hypothetical protein